MSENTRQSWVTTQHAIEYIKEGISKIKMPSSLKTRFLLAEIFLNLCENHPNKIVRETIINIPEDLYDDSTTIADSQFALLFFWEMRLSSLEQELKYQQDLAD